MKHGMVKWRLKIKKKIVSKWKKNEYILCRYGQK